MAAETRTDRHERAAVAFAHEQIAAADLIWRELTGRDIGIDAACELPYDDLDQSAPRGFTLIQVKSRDVPVRDGNLVVTYTKRNHVYWLTQRLPVVICVVRCEDTGHFSRGAEAYWIDYKALPQDIFPTEDPDRTRWTLKVPIGSDRVWPRLGDGFSTWQERANSLRVWLTSVLARPAEEIGETIAHTADQLLGSGKPSEAQKLLDGLPLWERVLLKEPSREKHYKLISKSFRRSGLVERQESLAGQYRSTGQPVPDFLEWELAVTYWTRACMTEFPAVNDEMWRKALKTIGRPAYRNSKAIGDLKHDLVWCLAYVNIRSTLACLPGCAGEAPEQSDCSELRQAIAAWTRSEDARVQEPRFQAHLLNALRAATRGFLSRGDLANAEQTMSELQEHMLVEADREHLALTDLFLLMAWTSVQRRDLPAAKATLECTRHLLRAMHDPLLEWFQGMLVAKAREST